MIPKHLVKHALDICDSIQRELNKGLDGGVVAGYFLREKHALLSQTLMLIERHGVDTVEGCERPDFDAPVAGDSETDNLIYAEGED